MATKSRSVLRDVASTTPTRVRYGVLALACSLSMVNYLDKFCMGAAKKPFADDLGLNDASEVNIAISAFALAYALFEVPSGWLGDVFGPRRVIIRIVLWWSFFTVLTGFIGMHVGGYILGGLTVLVIVRFLFGAGEAGCYPNITRSLHNWFPYHERGFAQGAVWMCGRLMGGLTPFVWMILVKGVGNKYDAASGERIGVFMPALLGEGNWRATFYLFGIIGVAWCIWFALWFRNRPEEKPSVNQAELELIRRGAVGSQAAHANIPWLKLLRSPNLWLLGIMYACLSYGFYFYMVDLPNFFDQQYNVEQTSVLSSLYKGGPLWMGAIGCIVGGILTDRFIRRTGRRRLGRSLFGMGGEAMTALCFFAAYWIESMERRPDPFWFFLAIALSGFFNDLTMGPAWATVQDIGKRYAAIVAGFMNMIGNIGGAVASWASGLTVQKAIAAHATTLGKTIDQMTSAEKAAGAMPGFRTNFLIYGAVLTLAAICWALIDATKPVAPDEE
jgi:MFS transporter, ACS family, glucarate transporter